MANKRVMIAGLSLGVGASLGWQAYQERYSFSTGLGLGKFYYYAGSLVRKFVDGEEGHVYAVKAAAKSRSSRIWLGLVNNADDPPVLNTTVFGLDFQSPVGIAAGFDKNAEAVDGLFDMGLGFVEIGSVTPLAQPGNPKPRVFRLAKSRHVINRYGFNSDGLQVVKERLEDRLVSRDPKNKNGVLGINLGKNKKGEAVADYVRGVKTLGHLADYLVVNVSSPNTPGLRALQGKEYLLDLLTKVKRARDELKQTKREGVLPPLLVKIAPDLSDLDKKEIADVIIRVQMDGLIVSNTTVKRPKSLAFEEHLQETGGLSGPVLMEPSTKLISQMYKHTDGKIPIIGVGGVSSAEDAYAKIKAGASLVQFYTAFIYDGPCLIENIKDGLTRLAIDDGYSSISQAVGANVTK